MDKSKSTLLSEADGRRLAIDMLLEMSALDLDELAIDGTEAREGRPQSDVVRRYLRTARENASVEAGFIAVLTDALGSFAEGRAGDTLAGFYEAIP